MTKLMKLVSLVHSLDLAVKQLDDALRSEQIIYESLRKEVGINEDCSNREAVIQTAMVKIANEYIASLP